MTRKLLQLLSLLLLSFLFSACSTTYKISKVKSAEATSYEDERAPKDDEKSTSTNAQTGNYFSQVRSAR